MNKKEVNKYDGIDKYIDYKLNEVAECFYNFMRGFLDLDKQKEPEKDLINEILDEYYISNGLCVKLLEEAWVLEQNLRACEAELNKDNKEFNINSTMIDDLNNKYDEIIEILSKNMFMYGVKFGMRLANKV